MNRTTTISLTLFVTNSRAHKSTYLPRILLYFNIFLSLHFYQFLMSSFCLPVRWLDCFPLLCHYSCFHLPYSFNKLVIDLTWNYFNPFRSDIFLLKLRLSIYIGNCNLLDFFCIISLMTWVALSKSWNMRPKFKENMSVVVSADVYRYCWMCYLAIKTSTKFL